MAATIEQLPATLQRRNWIVLGALLAGSLPFANWPVTVGVLAGGLVAIAGFAWLHRSLRRLLAEPAAGSRVRYQFGYVVRLIVLGGVLALLIAVAKIHPVGLAIGLSVVVINLLWLTLQRALR
ncbi:MAG: ATP synthase subunit I [Deltaproteobacteria bacterium]|nr:MAG: ATP synthase subunit I [Deltaproteobacteria bacterium]